ncbi:hypothetical protein LZV21_004523 [Salmonella enterica]|nr:hypothetical protein [Salmonella enterica]EJG8857846.1 hypothetical protein [Salmonella enterica]
MKEDILNVIERKVSPLIKVWMNEGKSSLNISRESCIKDSIDSKEDVDIKLLAVKYLLLEYVNEYAPDDYIEEMTERLNDIFDDINPICSLFYGFFDIRMVSYSFEYYLSYFYYQLMIIEGDEEDLMYVRSFIKNEGV